MVEDDPLAKLMECAALEDAHVVDPSAATSARIKASLDELARMLETPGAKLPFDRIVGFGRFGPPVSLAAADLPRAERLMRALWNAQGAGKARLEEGLLDGIAYAANPASLPLFVDAIAFSKPRDKFIPRRRQRAIAGVAFLAWRTGIPEAHALLETLSAHEDLRVRCWAVDGIARTHRTEAGALTTDAAALLERVAQTDRAFEPRFLASSWLYVSGRRPPVASPGGVFGFNASFGKASRTIELRSEQPLDALAWAIVGAFNWDSDHLYEFRLSHDVDQPEFRVAPGEDGWIDRGVTGSGPFAMPVGAFGFVVGHVFELLYDFGDDNRFRVEVVGVRDGARAGATYPRVAAKVGRAPAQYPGAW